MPPASALSASANASPNSTASGATRFLSSAGAPILSQQAKQQIIRPLALVEGVLHPVPLAPETQALQQTRRGVVARVAVRVHLVQPPREQRVQHRRDRLPGVALPLIRPREREPELGL